jgi:prephenate dehydrogenase
MWRDIFAANADQISLVLRQLASELNGIAAGLEESPPDLAAALGVLATARQQRAK